MEVLVRRAADDSGHSLEMAGIMIRFLAKLFRGLHLIFGVSAPPPGQNERTFVLAWLGILAFLAALGALLTYLIPYLYFRQ